MSFSSNQPYNNLPQLPPARLELESSGEYHDFLLKARTAIAELKGYTATLSNPLLLFSSTILSEAVESSEIENVHTTVVNALESQVISEAERSEADRKVINYKNALMWGARNLERCAISTRLITGVFTKILPDESGAYRRVSNQIANVATGEVFYTPPDHPLIANLMQNWENFVNENKSLDPLVRAAIAHYQFESIHPFEDGNGRTGRILIVLQLIQDALITGPFFYISGYINKTKEEYYGRLRLVTRDEAWEEFILYMLRAFYQQAKETKEIILSVKEQLDKFEEKLKIKNGKIYSSELAELLFEYPFITPTTLAKKLKVHYTTASRYLNAIKKSGLLEDKKSGRQHFYINFRLLDIINRK